MKLKKYVKKISLYGTALAILCIIFFISFNSKSFPQMIFEGFKDLPSNKKTISNLEKAYNDNIAEKNRFLEIYSLSANHMDQKVLNDRVKLNNGMLLDTIESKDIIDTSEAIKNIEKFAQYTNIPFIYIQLPNKMSNANDLLPKGILDDSQKICDEFLENLKQKEIANYDLRVLYNDDNREKMFFKTDHHWTSQGAFTAYRGIADILENYGILIPEYKRNINNFESKVYKNIFLGSSGKRTGIRYTGLDDFELLYPKFDTDFYIEKTTMYDDVIVNNGNYTDVLIDENYLTYDYYNYNVYNSYLGSSYKHITIENKGEDYADKKVLLLRDSYAKPLICFLANGIKNIDAIDMRYVEDDFSLIDYVNSTKPDIIIMMYSPFMYENEICFQHLF